MTSTLIPGWLQALGVGTLGALSFAAVHGSAEITRPPRTLPEHTPAELGLPYESITFMSRDGIALSAWLLPHRTSNAAIILLHGFGGNKGTVLGIAQMLSRSFTVLVLDLRGHGESSGDWTSVGYYERQDVMAASQELARRGYERIGALGISMGAATAILAAAEDAAISSIVADSAFSRLRHAVTLSARERGYPPGVAEIAAATACLATSARLRYHPRKADPVEVVARIAPRPLFIIHGESDAIIPLTDAFDLYATAGEPCTIWTLPDLPHAEAFTTSEAEYGERVTDFFTRTLTPG